VDHPIDTAQMPDLPVMVLAGKAAELVGIELVGILCIPVACVQIWFGIAY
jgi:hypothetical protein